MRLGIFASVLFLALTSFGAPSVTPAIRAKIFDKDGKELLFNYEQFRDEQGNKISLRNVFTGADGKEAVIEKAQLTDRKVSAYELDQKQLGAQGKIEVRDGRVFFSYTEGGKTKTGDEKLKDNFVVGPSLVTYAQDHWTQIKSGEAIDIRLAVLDRRETVGFTLKKISDTTFEGQKAIAVRMKPTSFVIAALVSPLQFTFAEDGSRLLEIRGRAVPKRMVDGKFKDLDARTLYVY